MVSGVLLEWLCDSCTSTHPCFGGWLGQEAIPNVPFGMSHLGDKSVRTAFLAVVRRRFFTVTPEVLAALPNKGLAGRACCIRSRGAFRACAKTAMNQHKEKGHARGVLKRKSGGKKKQQKKQSSLWSMV